MAWRFLHDRLYQPKSLSSLGCGTFQGWKVPKILQGGGIFVVAKSACLHFPLMRKIPPAPLLRLSKSNPLTLGFDLVFRTPPPIGCTPLGGADLWLLCRGAPICAPTNTAWPSFGPTHRSAPTAGRPSFFVGAGPQTHPAENMNLSDGHDKSYPYPCFKPVGP